MITALAFFGLALIALGAVGWMLIAERRELATAMDRRLDGLRANTAAQFEPVVIEELRAFGPMMLQADVEITRERALTLVIAVLAATVLALILSGPLLALVVVLGLPACGYLWLRRLARTRIAALVEGLPHYIDGIRQLLAIGASPAQAVVRALQEAPQAVQRYFEPAARRVELGTSVDDAIDQLARSLRVPEVSMLAAALRTQMRFGGSIGLVLTNLAQLLRDQINVRRDLKAATAEARVSAKVLIAMPLVAMGMLVLGNPEYPEFFLSDPRGQNLGLIAVVLQAAGIIVVRRQMELVF
jgi:tight adherence protein B